MKRNFIRIISMFLIMLFLSMTYPLKDASAVCLYCDDNLPFKMTNIDMIKSLNHRAKDRLIVALIELVESKEAANTKEIDAILRSAIQGKQVKEKNIDGRK